MASLESRSTGHTVTLQALTSVIVRVPCPPGKGSLSDCHVPSAAASAARAHQLAVVPPLARHPGLQRAHSQMLHALS